MAKPVKKTKSKKKKSTTLGILGTGTANRAHKIIANRQRAIEAALKAAGA